MHFFSELWRALLVFRLITLRPATISFQAHNLASTQAVGFSRDQSYRGLRSTIIKYNRSTLRDLIQESSTGPKLRLGYDPPLPLDTRWSQGIEINPVWIRRLLRLKSCNRQMIWLSDLMLFALKWNGMEGPSSQSTQTLARSLFPTKHLLCSHEPHILLSLEPNIWLENCFKFSILSNWWVLFLSNRLVMWA